MEATLQNAQAQTSGVGPSNPPPSCEPHYSNVDGFAIEICSGPMFGLDNIELHDDRQPPHSDDFLMIFDDEESSGSQLSSTKPKEIK